MPTWWCSHRIRFSSSPMRSARLASSSPSSADELRLREARFDISACCGGSEKPVGILRILKPHRSCLSVPASSARMQTKAVTLDADQVLFDLEDATAPSEKAGARSIAVESLKRLDFGGRCVAVRANGVDTQWC